MYGAMHALRTMEMNANIIRIFRINLQIVKTYLCFLQRLQKW